MHTCNAAWRMSDSDAESELTSLVASSSHDVAAIQSTQSVIDADIALIGHGLGQWYFEQGRYTEAIKSFEDICKTVDDTYESACARSNVGVSCIKSGDFERAQRCLARACMLFEGLPLEADADIKQDALTTKFNLGLAYLRLGNKTKVFDCLGQVAQESDSYEVLQGITSILLQHEPNEEIHPDVLDEAKLVLTRIAHIKNVPVDIRAWTAHNLAVIAYKKRNFMLARRYFICARNLNHPEALTNLKKIKALTSRKGEWADFFKL